MVHGLICTVACKIFPSYSETETKIDRIRQIDRKVYRGIIYSDFYHLNFLKIVDHKVTIFKG